MSDAFKKVEELEALEAEVVNWIQSVTGDSKGDSTFAEWLHDGKVLCQLANSIHPGAVKKVNEQKMPFKQMENIKYFTDWARSCGVPESSMFATGDLYEERNVGAVTKCLYIVGGAVQVSCPDFTGPKLGSAMTVSSHDHKRASGVATQTGGFAGTMDTDRPKDPRFGLGIQDPADLASSGRDSAVHGLDADLKAKQDASYPSDIEGEVVAWVGDISGLPRDPNQSVFEWLQNGQVLCHLANNISPGAVKHVNTQKMPFKQMENIKFFTDWARSIGVAEYGMFATPDLYEEKNMGSVIKCIYAVGGQVQVAVPEFTGPKLGTPMVKSNDHARDKVRATQGGGFAGVQEVARPKDSAGYVAQPIQR